MLGSYGPHPKGEAYAKNFDPEESPSGILVRTGAFNVRSRVIDDDGEVYAGTSPDSCKRCANPDVLNGQTGSGLSSSRKSGERLASLLS